MPNTLPMPPQLTIDRRSPSPNSVNNNNLTPTSNTNKSSVKRLSNPTPTISTKTDDFVLIPDQITIEKSLPSGNHTSFAQLSREKRLVKDQHRTLSEGIL